jgi:PST family polysaccharide transporter
MVFLPLVFSAIIAPLVTQAIVKEEFARIRSLTDRSFRLLIIFAVLIALIISSAPDTIIHVLFGGDKYQDAAPIVILFGWMFIPLCFGIFMAEIAVAEGILWLPAVYFGTAMIFSITLDIILIPKYGALGSAIAKTIGTTCGAATLFLFSKKLVVVEWKFFLNFILKLFLILLIVIPVRYLFISLQLNEILIVCFVCACFMVLVLLLKAIQLREAVSFVNSISGRNRKL